MRILVLLSLVAALASASYMTSKTKEADSDFLAKQKVLFEIFMNVWQPEIHNKYFDEAKNFDYVKYKDFIACGHAWLGFVECYELGFLGMEEIFNPMDAEQNQQLLSLFKIFYFAKDWDTFYNFLLWARFNVNPGMFVQAVTMAVLHRKDFAGFVLPAIYEISPYYFFNSYVVSKTQRAWMEGIEKVDNIKTYTVPMNYTNYYYDMNYDGKVAYFMEDIGLNSYYYYMNMDYYAYLGGDEFGLNKDRRGEFYLYEIRQLLARYYLERLSNGLGEIPEINFNHEIETGYYPSLTFFNGVNFPTRTNYYMMYLNHDNQRYLDHLYGLERRIFDAIDSGYFLKPNGEKMAFGDEKSFEYLGNMIQHNKDTLGNFYYYGMLETFYRKLLSGSIGSISLSDNRIPSVLELFETSMRDPMFYVFYKRISFFYDAFVYTLPSHTKKDLEFEGVKFTGVEIDKLLTFFDFFTADVTNLIHVPKDTKDFIKSEVYLKAQVPRLNHLPFNVRMKLTSSKAQKTVLTMFVGPKYDSHGNELTYNENRNNFWELDRWLVELKEGENIIDRKSTDFTWFVNDRTTYYDLYKNLMTAINGGDKFPLDMSEAHCGFPSRLMLPRGRVGGYPVQFFFMAMPYDAPEVERFSGYDPSISCGVGSGARYLDKMPFGFPFDRKFDMHFKPYDNMFFYDTFIYHKMNQEFVTFY